MAHPGFVLLCVASTSSFALAQLQIPTTSVWPPPSGSATCNNSLSSALLKMFSPDTAFSTVVISSFSFVNSTFICTSMSDSEVALLRPTIQIYFFYGPKNTDYQVETLDTMKNLLTGGHWNFSRPTTCFFPGWTKTATSQGYSLDLVDAYLANASYNLIAVEWSKINQMEYTRVVSVMPNVARWLAAAFDAFSNGTNVTSMVFVGHSLGAHLAGYTSRLLGNLEVPFLAALDPAGPLFSPVPWRCQEGVRAGDAQFVMSLHTDIARFGTDVTIGTVDYFANNGTYVQPGCSPYDTNPAQCTGQFLCSHTRALLFWSGAIRFPGSFLGCRCSSSTAFAAGMCSGNEVNDITAPTRNFGQYYFKSNAESPYGKGIQGV